MLHVARGIPFTTTVHPACTYSVFERVETEFVPFNKYPIDSVMFDGHPKIIKPRLVVLKRVDRRSGDNIEKLREMRIEARKQFGKDLI